MDRRHLQGLEVFLADNPHSNAGNSLSGDPPTSSGAENEKLRGLKKGTGKTGKITSGYKGEAEDLGLIASWSHVFGYVSIRDPEENKWHDVAVSDAPGWALWEARKRKELDKGGEFRAYRLTSRQMEEVWEAERPMEEEGIVEEYPIENEAG